MLQDVPVVVKDIPAVTGFPTISGATAVVGIPAFGDTKSFKGAIA
jgi:hypothetical protein